MASSTPFDGTNFLTGAPDEDQPHGNDFQEHQSTRKSMKFVNDKEHDAIANDPSAADGGGEHKIGSAKIYHGDYSTASAGDNLPTLRPDGATALDSSDAGRLAYDTDATFGKKYYRWDGSAWQQDLTSDDETTLAGKSWFLDEDDMTSDDNTKVASQQSIKAYIDNQTNGDLPVTVDSESNAMLKSHAYLTQTSGFVTAFTVSGTNSALTGFVGTTTDPVGAGVQVGKSDLTETSDTPFISFFVGNGKYFECRTTTGTLVLTWTPFVVGGGNPIDQD